MEKHNVDTGEIRMKKALTMTVELFFLIVLFGFGWFVLVIT
jgi:hypothetical protein